MPCLRRASFNSAPARCQGYVRRSAGAKLLYLPPYSPDFKPIEWLFAIQSLAKKGRQADP